MQLLLVKIWNCPQVYVIFDTWPILPRYVSSPVPSTCSIRRHIRVSTSNRARCNINRLHESIGSLGSLCRSLYRRTHVALRCTTRSTDPLVRLWPRKENYVHAYLPRAAETHISFYHLPFLFLFFFFFWIDGIIISGLWVSCNNSRHPGISETRDVIRRDLEIPAVKEAISSNAERYKTRIFFFLLIRIFTINSRWEFSVTSFGVIQWHGL